jgi:hypothetical protein
MTIFTLNFKLKYLKLKQIMYRQIKIFFLLLVLIQGLHSIEEYFGRLWEVFLPAKYLISLVSNNYETGFLVMNIGLFISGLIVWLFIINKKYLRIRVFIWSWIAIEIINGIGHPLWALIEDSYEPGVITAPLLLVIAIYLSILLIRFESAAK